MIVDCVAHWFPGLRVERLSLQRLIDAFLRIPKIERLKSGEDQNDHRGRVEEHVRNLDCVNGN